ncbi:hypothetical protein D3C84_787950 [compost metagenome]
MDSVPFFSLENSWAICLMLSTLRRISPAVVMIRSPAGVTRVRCLPLRANTSTPSSSSSRRICLLMPGCEV